jgi:hypothetical protein
MLVIMLIGLSFVVGIIWLSILTYLYTRLYQHYNTLISGTSKKNIQEILEKTLKEVHVAKKDIDSLIQRCDTIEREGLHHIQKVGLLRFNPFKDTGGDQSFILSLVDANNSGIVVSGLYSRSGTRWYAKKVILGKGVDHTLTDEEKEAIKLAKSAE